ncbi:MAG: toll/interleukin-1 receptor domain-containing protein [Pseudomonadota bacterium]
MPKVFVSYRRSDSREAAVRIADELVDEFGDSSVFFDTETIEPGKSFPAEILTNINTSTHVLVIIGPDWLMKNPETGIARIEEPEDWVRREIRTALSHPATVIPVLVSNAQMPSPEELPLDLRTLTEQNAVELRPDRFKGSLTELVDRLRDQSALRAAWIMLIAGVLAATLGLTLQSLFVMFHGLFESIQQTQRAIGDLATHTGAALSEIQMMEALATPTGIHMSGNFATALQVAILAYGTMLAALSYLPLARSQIPLSVAIGLCAYMAVELIAFLAGNTGAPGDVQSSGLVAAFLSSAKLAAMCTGLLWPQQRSLKLELGHIAGAGASVFLASSIGVFLLNHGFGQEDGASVMALVQTLQTNPAACVTATVYSPCDADAEAVQVVAIVSLVLLFAAALPGARIRPGIVILMALGWTLTAGVMILIRKSSFGPDTFFADAKLGTAVLCAVMAFTLARWHLRRPSERKTEAAQ